MISESGQYFWVSCPDAVGGTRAPLAVCGSLEPQLPLETKEQRTASHVTAGGQSPLCFRLMSNLITRVCFHKPAEFTPAVQVFPLCEIAQYDKKLKSL